MTPLERLLDDHWTAYRLRAWYASAEWERVARRVIAAMAKRDRRGLTTKFNHVARRLRASMNGGNP